MYSRGPGGAALGEELKLDASMVTLPGEPVTPKVTVITLEKGPESGHCLLCWAAEIPLRMRALPG